MSSLYLYPLPPDAIAAVERGELLQAVRLVREHTGLGLKESKDAVDRYQAGEPLPLAAAPREVDDFSRAASGFQSASSGLPADAIAALGRGRKVEAVKLVRDARPGLGLAEAKDLVDAYAAGQSPSLYEGFVDNPPQSAIKSDPMAEPGRVTGGSWRPSIFWIAVVLLAVFGVWSLFARL